MKDEKLNSYNKKKNYLPNQQVVSKLTYASF